MDHPSPSVLAAGAFLGGAAATYALTPLAGRLAHRVGAIDVPGGRRVHSQPTPRLGGLAIFGGLTLGASTYAFTFGWKALVSLLAANTLLAFLLPCLMVFAAGVVDDIRGLSAVSRLAVEAFAAVFLIQAGYVVDNVTNPFGAPIDLGMFSFPITLLWIVGVTNAFNLMDGLDGLLSTVGLIVLSACGVVALATGRLASATLAFALAGALLGFLPHNWHPARIFLGDSGSLVVGFTAAALSLKAATTPQGTLSFHVAVALCALPLCETALTIARRYVNGTPYFSGDRSHIHHVMLNRGLSVKRAVGSLAAVTLVFASVAILSRFWRHGGAFTVIVALLAMAGFGLRWLGYVELRVFWDRIRHSLFRKHRRGLPEVLAMAEAGERIELTSSLDQLPEALQAALEIGNLLGFTVTSPVLPDQGERGWTFRREPRPTDLPQLHVRVDIPLPPSTGELGRLTCHYAAPWGTPAPAAVEVERYLAWPLAKVLTRLAAPETAPTEPTPNPA
jgi:UDP-GlcNAc:undecaprenyl-phosphate GlcNAc-1-phosphate transferase